jgi:hypothetical protein
LQPICIPLLAQNVPAPVQPGCDGGVQTQAPWPAAPWQVECALHAESAFGMVKQPWPSATQVVTALPLQYVPAPAVQAAGAELHMQAAAPFAPWHVSFDVQFAVLLT